MNYELYENINYNNIENLYYLIKKDSNYLDSVKIQYLRKNKFFLETLNFLIDINLVQVENNTLIIIKNLDKNFKKNLFYSLIKKPDYGSCLKSYIDNFTSNEELTNFFKPDPLYNNLTIDLRNFLISSKTIKYENGYYILIDESILILLKKKEFSPQDLQKVIDKNNLIGLEAEKIIYNEEKNKFAKLNSNLKPDHISLRDVSAGYDILSYQKNNDNFEKIFIEVKAVSRSNYTFHLSVQELQTAKRYKGSYYIYLLPVDPSKKEGFDLDKILKINNINQNIINNKTDWCIDNDGYLITRIG